MPNRATPPPKTPAKVPPPASWLRGAGLLACAAVLLSDVAWDHHLDGNGFGYLAAFLVAVYGPDLVLAAPDLIRAFFRRNTQ